MKQISTQNLFILHAYGETSPEQEQQVADGAKDNETFRQEVKTLNEAKDLLDRKLLQPSNTSVRIIMEYSHKSESLQEI